MTKKEISTYTVGWNPATGKGGVNLTLVDGGKGHVHSSSPALISLLVDILRNEKPVYYVSRSRTITTGEEPVGEGEA